MTDAVEAVIDFADVAAEAVAGLQRGADLEEAGEALAPAKVKRGVSSKLDKLKRRNPGIHRALMNGLVLVGRWLGPARFDFRIRVTAVGHPPTSLSHVGRPPTPRQRRFLGIYVGQKGSDAPRLKQNFSICCAAGGPK